LRGQLRIRGRHPGAPIIFDLLFQVITEFFIEIGCGLLAPEERAQGILQSGKPANGRFLSTIYNTPFLCR
jgi:hypothetical protein